MGFLDNNGVARLWHHIVSALNTKVDKVDGKGLSTEDYTTTEKEKLASIEFATDEEIMARMLEDNIIPVVYTETGAVLSSGENTILMI